MVLHELVMRSAARCPEALAVRGDDGDLSYGELDASANRLARALLELGIGPGDRVGVWLDKSPRAVAAMQGALRAGAVYVPIDPLSPVWRAQGVIADCGMRALVAGRQRVEELRGAGYTELVYVVTDGSAAGALAWGDLDSVSAEPPEVRAPDPHDPAYILYTSGSTGAPKGVCISHENARAFLEWAVTELEVTAADRFANHAPFHFDLSVLDLYGAFWVGASVHLVSETASFIPGALVEFVCEQRPTIWYSVPSALVLMMKHGGLADVESLPMRAILFAGEPYPIERLVELQRRFPAVRLLNLYGPTETNVCTFYEVKGSLEGRTRPVPIGRACSGNEVRAVDEDGNSAGPGEEGELLVSGPTVMLGYWGHAPQRDLPYRTGDLVRVNGAGEFEYIGRRDQMIKIRGFRVELGEIEATLRQHAAVREAAVAAPGGSQPRLVAFLETREGGDEPPLIELKRFCAARLPRYMIVDKVRYVDGLPRTRNGKLDRAELERRATEVLEMENRPSESRDG